MRAEPAGPLRASLTAWWRACSAVLDAVGILFSRFRTDRPARTIITGLILANLSFGVLYLAHYALPELNLAPDFLLLDRDQSLPEFLNYAQTFACAALLVAVYVERREGIFLSWALIFLFVVLDDALSLHEEGAQMIRGFVDLPALPGLRPQDTGELMVWSLFAVPLFAILIAAFRRSGPVAAAFGGVFALLFMALVFFAVAFDMVHSWLASGSFRVERLTALAEDGGEMLTLALACGSALLLHRHCRARRGAEETASGPEATTNGPLLQP
jgi:hypothetical protein